MRSLDDPSFLTPGERLSEVAGILAAGVLRLHARAALPGDNSGPEKSLDSSPAGLEVSGETVLSVYAVALFSDRAGGGAAIGVERETPYPGL